MRTLALASGRRVVVREDLVDLVAPALVALQPADVRTFLVAAVDFLLRVRAVDEVIAVRLILLGKAEVDERAVPCVAKRHAGVGFSPVIGEFL